MGDWPTNASSRCCCFASRVRLQHLTCCGQELLRATRSHLLSVSEHFLNIPSALVVRIPHFARWTSTMSTTFSGPCPELIRGRCCGTRRTAPKAWAPALNRALLTTSSELRGMIQTNRTVQLCAIDARRLVLSPYAIDHRW